MNPNDKPTNQPAGGGELAPPRASDPAQPPRGHDDEPPTVPDRPTLKSAMVPAQAAAVSGRVPPPAAPAASNAATASSWSPPDFPDLVFDWSVIRTDDPAVLKFPTQVNFYPTGAPPGAPATDPRSLLVDATLSSDRRRVTFSVSEESGRSPFLWGTLNYEPGATTASLTVTDLKYPGGSLPRQVLYP